MPVTELPSGLLAVESPAPPLPPVVTCQTCGATTPHPGPLLGHGFHTPAGYWGRHWWTCGHAKTWECPDCAAVPWSVRTYPACPECGCGCEYC